MKLRDIEFIKLLPEFMQDDPANIGLAKGVDSVVKMLEAHGEHLSTWTAINQLTEAELDELAWELNITWYEKNAEIKVKRELIKSSNEVKQRLGTGWAVERIIKAYFGEGHVAEWFEYEGKTGCFKVISSNPSITQENLDKFLRILEKIKRKSAHLEGIDIGLSGRSRLRMGAGVREIESVTIRPKYGEIRSWQSDLHATMAVRETETLTVKPERRSYGGNL